MVHGQHRGGSRRQPFVQRVLEVQEEQRYAASEAVRLPSSNSTDQSDAERTVAIEKAMDRSHARVKILLAAVYYCGGWTGRALMVAR